MFIVPLSGDKIQCARGTFTALGYTNLKDQPAVYVQGPEVETETIQFLDITKINGVHVILTPGKVFTVATKPKRQIQLPQRDDKVQFGDATVKVDSLKVNQHGHLAAGLLVVGVSVETAEKITVRLANLTGIERANGDKLLDLSAFKSQFSDYLGGAAT